MKPRVDRGKRLRSLPVDVYRTQLREQILRNSVRHGSGCWIWIGSKQKNGYASTRLYGRLTPAHRASFFAFMGEISEGMEVCHKCDVRDCVNPDHLFQATHRMNMADLSKKGRGRNGFMSGAFVPKRNQLGQFEGKV